ncbi:MAG: DNA repair protein RecO [Microgenomates group bacterium]
MTQRTFSCTGIVLKRINTGETDRIVTLLTKEQGKMVAVAKGVRTLSSTKRASLEPGNIVKAFFVRTKSLPLLTQTRLVSDCIDLPQTLQRLRQLSELLEILEKLFVEEELDLNTFRTVLNVRNLVISKQSSPKKVRESLVSLIVALGFQNPDDTKHTSISEYVASLSEKPMRSYEFLKLQH